jgi:hypothetical protein
LGGRFATEVKDLHAQADDAPEPDRIAFNSSTRMLRWALSVDPMALSNELSFGGRAYRDMKAFYRSLRGDLGGKLEATYRRVIDAAEAVAARQESPLARALFDDITELNHEVVVVVPRSAAVAGMITWLTELGFGDVPVVSPGSLTGPRALYFESLICLGGPRAFESGGRNYLSPMVSGYPSDTIAFLFPSWTQQMGAGPQVLISDGVLGGIGKTLPRFWAQLTPIRGEQISGDHGLTYVDLEYDADVASIEDAAEDAGAVVDCHRLSLGLGYHYFLETDAERVTVLDFASGRARPHQRRVQDLEIGEALVARLGVSEPAELRRLAFQVLGSDASPIADSQTEWKSRLLARGQSEGWARVAEELRSAGCQVSGQARRWSEAHSIRPRSASDFACLLGYLGYEDRLVPEVVTNARKLAGAIHLAARRLSSELEQTISTQGFDSTSEGTIYSIEMDGNPVRRVLVARLLDRPSSVVTAPESQIRRAMKD